MRLKLIISLTVPSLLGLFAAGNVQADSACDVVANTLPATIALYSSSCNTPRVDCDPVVGGRWMCANYNNPQYPQETVTSVPTSTEQETESTNEEPEPVEAPSTPITEDDVVDALGACVAIGTNIHIAMSNYQQKCPGLPRVDCDPLGNSGQYICGSYNNPEPEDYSSEESTPVVVDSEVTEPEVTAETESNTQSDEPTSVSSCVATGDSLQQAIANYNRECSLPRKDCDPTGYGGEYICGSYNNPIATTSPTRDETTAEEQEQSTDASTSSGTVEPTTTTPAKRGSIPSDSRYQPGDFIALHFDNAPDPDDGHATVVDLMIVDFYGLRDSISVISGAYGEQLRDVYQPGSEAVFYAAWGEEGYDSTWINAHKRYSHARVRSVARWTKALSDGGQVWVAEGGQSDFTADVMRSIAEASPNLNLKNIHVVQHSHGKKGFNESRTTVADMNYVKQRATYVTINNGNASNGTADLHDRNDFIANKFKRNAVYGTAWTAAFNYLNPFAWKFDGSDAVELLWILGQESDDVRNWTELSNIYLPR